MRDHKESGLTVMEWCRLHNVSKYQYYYRQRQVRKYAAQQLALQAPETSKPVFVEVDADMYQKPAQAEQTFPVFLPVSGPEILTSCYQMEPVKNS